MIPGRPMLFSAFVAAEQVRCGGCDDEVSALLEDLQHACRAIAEAAGAPPGPRGAHPAAGHPTSPRSQLALVAAAALRREADGAARSDGLETDGVLLQVRGRYLVTFQSVDNASGLDVNAPSGSIFSVLRARPGALQPTLADFLDAEATLACAGYALYGPAAVLVLTLGKGTHGFTLDRPSQTWVLTHHYLRIPHFGQEFAIDTARGRSWEPAVQRYVDECLAGTQGPRARDSTLRSMASPVAELHRILVCGGVFIAPRDPRAPAHEGPLRLVAEARPLAMVVEQAGGAASTGRERLLEVATRSFLQGVPAILGSGDEVERIVHYGQEHDAGADHAYSSPLFNERSLYRPA